MRSRRGRSTTEAAVAEVQVGLVGRGMRPQLSRWRGNNSGGEGFPLRISWWRVRVLEVKPGSGGRTKQASVCSDNSPWTDEVAKTMKCISK